MARISLENMRFRAYHGLYEEERLIGNDFILDIWVDADIQQATVVTEHNIEKVVNTVNYELVYEICRIEMSKPQKLLETVIEEIVYHLKRHFPNMMMVQIKLRKLNPPIGGQIEFAAITDVLQFQKECGKCGDGMICYKEGGFNDKTCWCEQEGVKDKIHPRTQELNIQQYKGICLCANCLKDSEG
jgi:7,8-dihydroneopterin aldolase/epimerase/oxygenase